MNLNDRDSQIKLLQDSPSLTDHVAAHLLTMDSSLMLHEANIRAAVLVAEFEKYQRTAPDYVEWETKDESN